MSERRRFLFTALVLVLSCASVAGTSIGLLYREHLAGEWERLAITAKSQAKLIEAVAKFNAQYNSEYPGGARQATLSQIVEAHTNFEGFGTTGEFTIASRSGDDIVFVLRQRRLDMAIPNPVPFDSELAEPMRRALLGESGTVVALDYRGQRVLAAYRHVDELDLGIVAKIDLAEVRGAFFRAGLLSALTSAFVIVVGVLSITAITRPILKVLGLRARQAHAIADLGQLALTDIPLQTLFDKVVQVVSRVLDTEFCKVLELQSDGKSLRMVAGIGWKTGLMGQASVGVGVESQAGFTLQSDAPVLVEDFGTETRFTAPPLLRDHGVVSGMSVVIPGKERPFGVLGAHGTKRRIFTKDDDQFLRAVANVLSAAIERDKSEKELIQSEEQFRTMFEEAPLGVALIDSLTGRIDEANPQFAVIAGRTREEMTTIDWMSITHPDDIQEVLDNMARLNAEEIPGFDMNTRYRHPDGSVVWINMTVASISVADESCPRHLCMIEDISGRKRAEEERAEIEAHLRNQQKLEAIGTLAGGIAHEINNPINGIMNYAQLIDDRLDPESPLREFAVEIGRETGRVSEIVGNLLAFARQEKESHSPANIADIVNNTLTLIRTIIRRDQITLDVDVPGDLPKIRCRSQQIRQVLMNLLTNARDALNARYSGHDPDKIMTVTVRVFEKNDRDWIRTTVEDHGAGIPVEIRDRIFEPFFTTKDRSHGTGLGLSISHGIIQDHRGELSFECETGRYTRFHLDLPVDNGWDLGNADENGNG